MAEETRDRVNTHVQTFVRATEKVCMHSHSPSLFLPVSHTHTLIHTLSNSLHQIKASAAPPPSPCHALWAVNTIQRNGSLEATKTSSYLTPDTRSRALGIKRRRANTAGQPNSPLAAGGIHSGRTETESPCNQPHLTHWCVSRSMRSQMGLSLSVHAWAVQGQPKANSGRPSGSR